MQHMFSIHFLQFLALVILFPVVVVSVKPIIINFGDSNSDTGGITAGLGLESDYPYGRAFFHPSTGRLSDGRLVIDFLCEYLGTRYLSPYLDSLDPDFSYGANFAISGACTLPGVIVFNLNVQTNQFKHFYKRSLELQYSSKDPRNLLGEDAFRNALYSIDIGQNDLAYAFGTLSHAQAMQSIPSFISEIKDAMRVMYEHGGRSFWVHNTGPLGCLPLELVIMGKPNSSDFDSYGCIKSLNEGAMEFNAKLGALCEELRSEMENSTIVYVDVYSIKYDLIANASSYGFENPLMACCGYGGPPYNYDPDFDKTCVGSRHNVCEEGAKYINWDGNHYTEAANAIVASKILSTRYSSPPLDFNFFCRDDVGVSFV